MAIKIALRFAAMRQQFGKPKEPEQSLIEYPLHQHRLFPILARVNSLGIVAMKIFRMWGKNQKHLFTPNNPKLAEFHALISVLKVIAATSTTNGI